MQLRFRFRFRPSQNVSFGGGFVSAENEKIRFRSVSKVMRPSSKGTYGGWLLFEKVMQDMRLTLGDRSEQLSIDLIRKGVNAREVMGQIAPFPSRCLSPLLPNPPHVGMAPMMNPKVLS